MRYDISIYGNFTLDEIIINNIVKTHRIGGGAYYSAKPFINDPKFNLKIHTICNPYINMIEKEYLKHIVCETYSTHINLFTLIYRGEDREIIVHDKLFTLPINASMDNRSHIIANPVLNEIDISLLKRMRHTSRLLAIDIQGFIRRTHGNTIVLIRDSIVKQVLSISSIVHLSIYEAKKIAGIDSFIDLDILTKYFSKINTETIYIITRDEKPPIIIYRSKYLVLGDTKPKTIDRTGAGDYFLASFVKEYILTNDIIQSTIKAHNNTSNWLISRNASSRPTTL
jgi:hypothetical protein